MIFRRLALAAVFAAVPCSAQRVAGVVAGSAHGEVVTYARVELLDPKGKFLDVAMRTDTSGRFELVAPKPGVYRLRATRTNYVTKTTDLFEIKSDATKKTVISLEQTPEMEDLERTVVGSKTPAIQSPEFDARRALKSGHFFLARDIREQNFATLEQLIAAVPNAYVKCSQGTFGRSCIATVRGGPLSSCTPAFYLNQVLLVRTTAIRPEDVILATPIDNVRAVEVYSNPGSVPGVYHGIGSDCGVIAVWTTVPR